MKTIAGSIFIIALIAGGWYLFLGDSTPEGQPAATDATLSIATSFYPLQFALERIVGDMGTVTNIGAGRDPHDYEPTTQDMLTLQRADLVVLQGADFEPWGDDVQARLTADNVPVVLATAELELHEGGHDHGEDEYGMHEDEHAHEDEDEHEYESEEKSEHHDEHEDDSAHEEESGDHVDEREAADHDEHDHGAYDPHTWLDPVLFSDMVGHLTEEIVALDPANATRYQANAETLQAELAALDTAYTDRLATCELDEVIISHDAFGYLAERYNFSVHAIAGLSTQDTPSATTLAMLREEAEEGIGAILLEGNSITAYGETLARETGLKTLSINPIAYTVPTGATYLTLMEDNLNTFASALNCNG